MYEAIFNKQNEEDDGDRTVKKYYKAVVNPGESYLGADGEWMDWADVIAASGEINNVAKMLEVDNFAIKLYCYSAEETRQVHAFGAPIRCADSTGYICRNCGYLLTEYIHR